MSSTPLASISALEDWLGLVSIDETRALSVLTAASAVVRDEAKKTWLDEEGELENVPEEIAGVVVRLAARLWANPSSATQQTSGPFSTSFARDLLSESDLRILNRKKPTTGLWTLSTTRGDIETQDLLEVTGSDKPMPISRNPW